MDNSYSSFRKKAIAGIPGVYNSFLYRRRKLIVPIVLIVFLSVSIFVSINNVSANSLLMDFAVEKPTVYYLSGGTGDTPDFYARYFARREGLTQEELQEKLDIIKISGERQKTAFYQHYGLYEEDDICGLLVDEENHIVLVYYKFSDFMFGLIDDMKDHGIWEGQ